MKGFSPRKAALLAHYESIAPQRDRFRCKAAFFHGEDLRYLRFLIPEGLRILELGCGSGDVLAALKPRYGVGVDLSPTMIAQAKQRYPDIEFRIGDIEDADLVASLPGPFDVILIADTIGSLEDCQATLELLHQHCTRATRIVIVYYSHLWEPLLKFAEWIGWRAPQPNQNIMSPAEIRVLGDLADFELVKAETRLLSPLWLFGIGRLLNRFVSMLPIVRHLSLRHYSVCRSLRLAREDSVNSATVLIPVRNERGNIERAIESLPRFCGDIEVVFVEGHSKDGTYEEIERVMAMHPDRDIKLIRQVGHGKGDAVFAGFDMARGDVLMILDGDLTVPPDQLPKFWQAIVDGKGEFINGSRLVYPMEDEAMQFLNLVANRLFSVAFTWLLNQRFTDTLCGTKVLRRTDYERLKAGRAYFGDFDPFGDFDLIFGAAKLNLRCIEIPIRYARRTYGETQISRFRHRFMLIKMLVFAFFRIKAL
jgi:SAM-dependent methyltransferase